MPDFIPMDHDLPDKPELLAIVEATGITLAEGFFRMWCLWRIADRQTTDGVLAGVGPTALAARAGGTAEFWETVARVTKTAENPEGWLFFDAAGAHIPQFGKWLSKPAKARIKEACRKKSEWRAEQKRRQSGENLRKVSGKSPALPGDNPETNPETNPEKTSSPQSTIHNPRIGEERSGEDQVSISKDLCTGIDSTSSNRDEVVGLALRKFRRGPLGILGQLSDADKATLLKLAALCVSGRIPEAWIDSGLEAIRHRTSPRPLKRPVAYLVKVAQTDAQAAGADLNQLLATVKVPAPENPANGET